MAEDRIIRDILSKLEEHEKKISKLERLFEAKPEAGKKETSLKEFILSKKPKNDIQRTLAIGYYLEKHAGLTSFNVRDLDEGFRAAKEKVPKNMPDKVQKNISKGHMMEAKEKKDNIKAYVLTNSGEKCVENGFKKEE